MRNEGFLVLFFKKEWRVGLAGRPRAIKKEELLFVKRSKNFLSILGLCLIASVGTAWAVSDPGELLSNPAQEARAEGIGLQLRCLVCQNESIEDSNADLARDIRTIIRQQVVAGQTDQQIIAYMVQRYGTFILLKPPLDTMTVVLWATPIVALLIGLGIAFFAVWRQRRRPAPGPAPLSAAERARLENLLRP
jgi:cytochrome c-type biogenesis protein CcmH